MSAEKMPSAGQTRFITSATWRVVSGCWVEGSMGWRMIAGASGADPQSG